MDGQKMKSGSLRPSCLILDPNPGHPRTFMGGRVPLTTIGTSAACHAPTLKRLAV